MELTFQSSQLALISLFRSPHFPDTVSHFCIPTILTSITPLLFLSSQLKSSAIYYPLQMHRYLFDKSFPPDTVGIQLTAVTECLIGFRIFKAMGKYFSDVKCIGDNLVTRPNHCGYGRCFSQLLNAHCGTGCIHSAGWTSDSSRGDHNN